MQNVVVITGGGSGMGLAVAKLMREGEHVIITGRTLGKLKAAADELRAAGVDVEDYVCDVSSASQVGELVAHAKQAGEVRAVIHAAGVSPRLAAATEIFTTNAVGTMNVNEQFATVMGEGSALLNVASMSGYMLPADRIPTDLWEASEGGPEALVAGFGLLIAQVPVEQAGGMAYSLSKNFVQWYSRRKAVAWGPKGIRVMSISPGTFATPMGKAEGDEAARFAEDGPLGRVGDPAEIARMMAFMVNEATYMTGVDVLYDGGTIAGLEARAA